MSILSAYSTARNDLYRVTDSGFLFPKIPSSYEQVTARHILTIATPPKCMHADFYHKKLLSNLDSKELRSVGVNSFVYSSDSFKLGGLKYMGPNNVVKPVFSNKNLTQSSLTAAGFSQTSTARYPSRKRTFDFVISNKVLVIRTIGNPGAAASKETENISSVPPTEIVTSERDEKFRDYSAAVRNNVFTHENP